MTQRLFWIVAGADFPPPPIWMWLTSWLAIGILGQAIFTARFLVQWAVSETRRDSVVPVAFWWLSLFGGLTLLSYAIHRKDPVFIVGQAMGLFIYVRNLMLVAKAKRRALRRQRLGQDGTMTANAPHRIDAPEPKAMKD